MQAALKLACWQGQERIANDCLEIVREQHSFIDLQAPQQGPGLFAGSCGTSGVGCGCCYCNSSATQWVRGW